MEQEIKQIAETLDRIEKRLDALELPHEANGQMAYTSDQTAKLIGLNDRRSVDNLRRHNLIRGTLCGKKYIYPAFEIQRFLRDNLGSDLSDSEAMDIAAYRNAKKNDCTPVQLSVQSATLQWARPHQRNYIREIIMRHRKLKKSVKFFIALLLIIIGQQIIINGTGDVVKAEVAYAEAME